jgi:hypothetical protein
MVAEARRKGAPPAASAAEPQPQAPQQPPPTRLFLGGLAPDTSAADVAARFAPFGRVAACEAVPPKGEGEGACRGFAYVTLEPKDAQSLARCLSLVRVQRD